MVRKMASLDVYNALSFVLAAFSVNIRVYGRGLDWRQYMMGGSGSEVT